MNCFYTKQRMAYNEKMIAEVFSATILPCLLGISYDIDSRRSEINI